MACVNLITDFASHDCVSCENSTLIPQYSVSMHVNTILYHQINVSTSHQPGFIIVLVDTWMLTVKPVYKLLNVSDDLKWTTYTHVTPFSLTFKA